MSQPKVSSQLISCHPDCSNLLGEYLDFLDDCQGLAQATIYIRRLYVGAFLQNGLHHRCSVADLATLAPNTIHDYVITTARSMGRALRKHFVSSLRSFLKFVHVKGYVGRNLVEAVPIILIRKLDRLPRGISWDDVQKLLAAPNRQTPVGRRDYAILQLLASYGVRIGQVTALRLGDIDWHNGLIHFQSSKHGKPLCFPLHAQVAEAILAYLRQDRGTADFPDLFLTVRGKHPRPLSVHNHLGVNFAQYFRLAGIDAPSHGAHTIRHAFATRQIAQGTPIKTIADLMGHKCINSTFIYTKVDIERLRIVAWEWPEEAQ